MKQNNFEQSRLPVFEKGPDSALLRMPFNKTMGLFTLQRWPVRLHLQSGPDLHVIIKQQQQQQQQNPKNKNKTTTLKTTTTTTTTKQQQQKTTRHICLTCHTVKWSLIRRTFKMTSIHTSLEFEPRSALIRNRA